MKVRKLFQKIWNDNKKENLYINVLLWAYNKQESGFSWGEIKSHFKLNTEQEHWVRNIFLTTSSEDRKFFEHLKNDDSITPNIHYYSLNEKGITAAVNYKGLEHAEKSSSRALWFAGASLFLTAIGLFFTIKQANLTEIQSVPERINQTRRFQSAVDFCKQNPDSQDSGLYEISTGKPATCSQVIQNYSNNYSFWTKIKNIF